MKKLIRFITSLLPLLLVVTLLAGNAQAALLDVGPTVPEVIGSSEPNLGHGFPLWYRDTNRLPLELCTDQAMCFFGPPTPAPALVSFPGNMPDEAFYWAAESIIPLPAVGVGKRAILVQALEAAFSTGAVVPGKQVSFARMRIRIDTPAAGTYLVTTPYRQYTFNIDNTPDAIAGGIFFSDDVGIAEGVFTGALAGNFGPFLYCANNADPAKNAPVIRATGSFLGDGVPCTVTGSPFLDPKTGLLANLFRIEGPLGSNLGGAGIDFVESNLFSVNGKIHTEVIPTPLTVDKASYALDSRGMQVNAFATTQPLSNKQIPGVGFPLNFGLSGQASSLQLSGDGIAPQAMTTNNAADGKFFSASGLLFPAPAAVPANVTVTNTADIPPTAKIVPLVDEVVVNNAVYNPSTKILSITATSYDTITNPTLTAFMPGMTAPLGSLANSGQLNVTFPVIDNSVAPSKTYAIPPLNITVTSAIGGSATAPVITFLPVQPVSAIGAMVAPTVPSPQIPGTTVTFIASGSGGSGDYEYRFLLKTGAVWAVVQDYSTIATWGWDTTGLAPGAYAVQVSVRSVGSTAVPASSVLAYSLIAPAPPASAVTLTSTLPAPQIPGASVAFVAAGSGGSGNYQYRFWLNTGGVWAVVQNYSSIATWTWNTTSLAPGAYSVQVDVINAGSTAAPASKGIVYSLVAPAPPATAVTLASLLPSPQTPGASVAFVAAGSGGSGNYQYRFWLNTGGVWAVVQNYSSIATWTWNTTGLAPGAYSVQVDVINAGSTAAPASKGIVYSLVAPAPRANAVTLTSLPPSPQTAGAIVTFVAAGSGGSGTYEYRFWLKTNGVWAVVQNYSTNPTWTWNTTNGGVESHGVQVDVRNVGSTINREATKTTTFTIL